MTIENRNHLDSIMILQYICSRNMGISLKRSGIFQGTLSLYLCNVFLFITFTFGSIHFLFYYCLNAIDKINCWIRSSVHRNFTGHNSKPKLAWETICAMVSEAMQRTNISFLAEGGSLSTGVVFHILLLGPIPEGPYLVKIFCSHVVL